MARFLLRRVVLGAGVVFLTAVFAYGSWRVLRADQFAGEGLVSGTWRDVRAALSLRFDELDWQEKLLPDVWMMVGTLTIGCGLGVAAGTYCVTHRGTLRARVIETLAMALLCTPPLVAGYALVYFYGPIFSWVHIYQEPWEDPRAWLQALILPWCIASLPIFGACVRLTLSQTSEAMDEEFTRTAIAKGLTHRLVVRRHGRAAAMPTVLAYMSAGSAAVVLNVTLIETVFSVPGLLGELRQALGASNVDYLKGRLNPPLAQQIALWSAVLISVTSIIFDLALASRDPRIRASGRLG